TAKRSVRAGRLEVSSNARRSRSGRSTLVTARTAGSAQLTVLVAAAVVARAAAGVRLVEGGLARHACAYTGQRVATRLRDRVAALFAVQQAFTGWQLAARAAYCIVDARVDLFLNGAVARPSRSHKGKATRAPSAAASGELPD